MCILIMTKLICRLISFELVLKKKITVDENKKSLKLYHFVTLLELKLLLLQW